MQETVKAKTKAIGEATSAVTSAKAQVLAQASESQALKKKASKEQVDIMNRLTAVTKERGVVEERWRQEVAAEKKLEVEASLVEKKTAEVGRQLSTVQTDLATAKTGYADTRA